MFLYVYRNLWGWRVHYVLLPHKQLRWIDSDEKSGFHPSTRHRRIKKKMMDDGMTGTSSTSFIMLISAVSAFLVCMYAIPISRSIIIGNIIYY